MAKRHWNRVSDFESLFLKLEDLVLANSGEDEFEEVFKLLIAKLWDEYRGGEDRFVRYKTPQETFDEVSTLLLEAERGWMGILEGDSSIKLTPEHLQVCVEALSAHNILGSDFQVLDCFFEFLVARSAKGAKGQFFTPRHVIELCVRMLAPSPDDKVLDPACGSGGFLLHTLEYVRKTHDLDTEAMTQYCDSRLWGFDISLRAVKVAKALMILASNRQANILRLNSLLRNDSPVLFPVAGTEASESTDFSIEDVCRTRMKRHSGFDLILTNPPFAGEVRESHILNGFELSRSKYRVERDVLFVERCVNLLRPGGRMAIVLPHNKFAGSSFSYLREWVLDKAQVMAVIGLGRNTFLPHTHQKASILVVKRREAGTLVTNSLGEKTFFAISEKDGKNSKGQVITLKGVDESEPVWGKVDHDFEEIVEAYRRFLEDSNPVPVGV